MGFGYGAVAVCRDVRLILGDPYGHGLGIAGLVAEKR